jgi:hypothetical protein
MQWRSKYIVIDAAVGGMLPVVFSELMSHADVAAALKHVGGGEIVGAGFCHITNILNDRDLIEPHYVCYGESNSLGVKSRGDDDSRVLNKRLGVIKDY